jgi:virginiamycin B lyase
MQRTPEAPRVSRSWRGHTAWLVLAGLLAALGLAPAPVGAHTAPEATITEYPLPTPDSLPGGIVVGPDGALWFYETGANQIGRIAMDGSITEYAIPTPGATLPRQGFLGVGPDGALWFTENAARRLGRITLDGSITEYPIPAAAAAPAAPTAGLPLGAITAGPDGALWVTEGTAGRLGRRAPDGSWQEIALPHPDGQPLGLIVGPDKAMWFTEVAGNRVGRASLDGQVTEYDLPTPNAGVLRLAAGPDGGVWFVEARAQVLGRIATDGQITEFPAVDVAAGPGVAAGPDGAVWFTSFSGNRIERMTLDGEVTAYAVPTENSYPYHILVGPDGALWFTEMDGNAIGRLALHPAEIAMVPTATPAATDPASSASGSGPVVFAWRTSGDAQRRLYRPTTMATDKNGDLYIVDGGNHRVQKFSGEGTFLTTWGSRGEGDGEFEFRRGSDHPGGIAVDAQGTVLVVDDNGRVQEFDRNGVFLRKWGAGRGTADGQFDEPTGMAVAPDGSIYIADMNNNRIQKFDASGRFLSKWGTRGRGEGQFDLPLDVAVDADGSVYVADHSNSRIQKFDSSGNILLQWGSWGTQDGQFEYVTGVAVDNRGYVYVCDNRGNRIEKFDTNGKFLGKWGSQGGGDGQFDFVFWITVDLQGNVYVSSDGGYDRVQKFRTR